MKFAIALIASVSAMQMGKNISPNCVPDDSGSRCHIEGSPSTICACPRLGYQGPKNCARVTGGFGSSVCMFEGTTDPCPCP